MSPIYQASTGQYFNGTNFVSGFRTVNATLTNPGDPNANWTLNFYNYTLTPFTTINHT